MTDTPRTPLPGSARAAARDAAAARPIDPSDQIELTVVLRRRTDGELGAVPGDLDGGDRRAAAGRARDRGQRRAVAPDPGARAGLGTVTSTFDTAARDRHQHAPDGRAVTHRQRTGELSRAGRPRRPGDRRARHRRPSAGPQPVPHRRAVGHRDQLHAAAARRAYDFPPDTDGTGQAVAIIELGGGFAQSDLDTYFGQLGITGPTVSSVERRRRAERARRRPEGADGEVLLDVEVVGALAPGAAISVYFAPNTDAGFLDAVSEAIHATPTPAAVSISWGQSEDDWTAQARTAMDAAFADAVQLGVVVTAAAGDNGSTDGATDGKDHCDFPASSPNVIGCGGTTLTSTAETVWNNGSGNGATGGGVSDVFDRPARQAGVGVPGSTGRGVPDVAGNADPQTGYQVLVDGSDEVIGGTSAVAPLWAALIARLAQATGGLLHGFADTLYAGAAAGSSPTGLRDITSGDNGSFSAGPGWDACTGLGSPDGAALLTRLQGST